MNNRSGRFSKLSFVFPLFLACSLVAQEAPRSTQLPNGKLLTDVPGNPRPINNLPTAIALSPDKRFAVLLHSGYGSHILGGKKSLFVGDFGNHELTYLPDHRLGRE